MKQIETRRFERHATHLTLSYRTDSAAAYKPGITHNISKNGLLLESNESIPQGEALELVLKIDDTPVHFKGRCMYCSESEQGNVQAGILILKVNTASMKAFLSFINTLETKCLENQHSLRPETAGMKNIVQRISAEHKIITQYVVVLQALMVNKRAQADLAEVEAILDLMKKDVTTHFYIEEKVFFHIGRTHLPIHFHGLIRELTQEHALLQHKLGEIQISVQEARQTGASWDGELKADIGEFLEQMKNHARKELIDLFPAIEDHAQAKSQILLALRKIVN